MMISKILENIVNDGFYNFCKRKCRKLEYGIWIIYMIVRSIVILFCWFYGKFVLIEFKVGFCGFFLMNFFICSNVLEGISVILK